MGRRNKSIAADSIPDIKGVGPDGKKFKVRKELDKYDPWTDISFKYRGDKR